MKNSHKASSTKQLNCPICFQNNLDTTINCCSHRFCFQCINNWTSRKPNCPICRRRIQRLRHGDKIKKVQKKRIQRQIPESPQRAVVIPDQENSYQFPMMPVSVNVGNSFVYGYYFIPFGYTLTINVSAESTGSP